MCIPCVISFGSIADGFKIKAVITTFVFGDLLDNKRYDFIIIRYKLISASDKVLLLSICYDNILFISNNDMFLLSHIMITGLAFSPLNAQKVVSTCRLLTRPKCKQMVWDYRTRVYGTGFVV